MSSENFENTEFEPSINDIFQVLNQIKQILTYLKNCDTISSEVLDINKQINIIKELAKEFHICLQKSIVQSNNFRNHAKDHVSDILQIHTKNVEENRKEVQEIGKKYKSVIDKLRAFHIEIFECITKYWRSLKHKKEDLKEDLKSLKQYAIILFIVVGFNLLIFQSIYGSEFLVSGIAIMVISALIKKTNIRQNEVNKLQKIIDFSRNELGEIDNKLKPLIIKINTFREYWVTLELLSEDLLDHLGLIRHYSTDNHRILISLHIKFMKPRWKKVKELCDNYIRTVCRTPTDVNNA